MNRGELPSHAPQLLSDNYYVYIHVHVCIHACVHVCVGRCVVCMHCVCACTYTNNILCHYRKMVSTLAGATL